MISRVKSRPSGADGAIRRIARTYDDLGGLQKVTSYEPNTGGNVKNEVNLAYDGWGQVNRSWQNHGRSVEDTDPNVQYVYADGAVSGAAKFVRLEKVVSVRRTQVGAERGRHGSCAAGA